VEAFRAEARAWLEANAPLLAELGDDFERGRAWQRLRFDGGWAGIDVPERYGGRGLTPAHARVFAEEQTRVGRTSGFVASTIDMVGPVLLAHGTEAQREQHLRPLLRADVTWCQLFSEPGAGSDLASLSARAVRDGDEFVVTGQKVWNSNAHRCDRGILLARTDPEKPKHHGITFFLADLRAPGIEVRPLRQISGEAHFNEVFLTEVRIPATEVVGEVDEGWAVARTVLGLEANVIGTAAAHRQVTELAGRAGPVQRQRLATAVTRERLVPLMTEADGSVLKVAWSEARAERSDLALELLGAEGTLTGDWPTELLNRFWGTIGGGTNEIHRTMVGERALGLPREPRA